MEYTMQNDKNAMNIALRGQFTFMDNQKFKTIIDGIQSSPIHSVNLDFGQIDFIDSAGLGMLLLLRDLCQNKQVPISIQSAKGQVHRIFMISKFDQLFTFKA